MTGPAPPGRLRPARPERASIPGCVTADVQAQSAGGLSPGCPEPWKGFEDVDQALVEELRAGGRPVSSPMATVVALLVGGMQQYRWLEPGQPGHGDTAGQFSPSGSGGRRASPRERRRGRGDCGRGCAHVGTPGFLRRDRGLHRDPRPLRPSVHRDSGRPSATCRRWVRTSSQPQDSVSHLGRRRRDREERPDRGAEGTRRCASGPGSRDRHRVGNAGRARHRRARQRPRPPRSSPRPPSSGSSWPRKTSPGPRRRSTRTPRSSTPARSTTRPRWPSRSPG